MRVMVPSKSFCIGKICVELQTEKELKPSQSFQEFAWKKQPAGEAGYRAVYKSTVRLPEETGSCVYENFRFRVCQQEDGSYCRIFLDEFDEQKPYAVSFFKKEEKEIQVIYLKEKEHYFEDVQNVFFYIAWEWILMNENRLLLHASYIDSRFDGLAFSGPSGIGKTTQARLWCTAGEGRMLNGDKLILNKEHGRWIGYGSPYAGSSACYVNDACPLKCLLFLKQGAECQLEPLSTAESFRRIYAELTVNYWDRQYVEKICDLAQQLSEDVPAYEFTCTPTKEAVDFLKDYLQKGENDVFK